ncbi:2-nitropropane dioxygenase, partial [Escherichia coli]|nr:2-nitropropane dioxygenase [Escherichia coli]
AFCAVVEELKPEVVSFHFGLPEPKLLQRVKGAGAIVMSSATTVREAIWLEENGADVVIAQGADAGGHRAMFLTENIS